MVDRWDPLPGRPFSIPVKSLPFGFCLKIGPRVSENEANALWLVEKYTTISAPRLINFTRVGETGYLLMTRVPGVSMDTVFWRMAHEERRQVEKELGNCIRQLRRVPTKASLFSAKRRVDHCQTIVLNLWSLGAHTAPKPTS